MIFLKLIFPYLPSNTDASVGRMDPRSDDFKVVFLNVVTNAVPDYVNFLEGVELVNIQAREAKVRQAEGRRY